MANELPPVSDCEDKDTTECFQPEDKCYSVKESIPVCASTNPSSQLKSSDCTRLDNTYDKILQAAVVPAVGNTMILSVCNASLYTVGSWIEFVSGDAAGSVFQILSINSVENYITVRNSCSDGSTAIDRNVSPGATINQDTTFIVVGRAVCETTDDKIDDLKSLLPELDEICLDGIGDKASTEIIKILGAVSSSDAEGSSPQPCLRFGVTKELKDGSLKLGNVDETPETDKTIVPLFVDVNNRVVTGEVDDEAYEWIKQNEELIEEWRSANIPNTSEFDEEYVITGTIPDDATHAIVRMHGGIDDPGGNIAVKFLNLVGIVLEIASDYSNSKDALARIDDGKIHYKVFAYNGGFMNWSGNTHLRMSIVGFKRVATLST